MLQFPAKLNPFGISDDTSTRGAEDATCQQLLGENLRRMSQIWPEIGEDLSEPQKANAIFSKLLEATNTPSSEITNGKRFSETAVAVKNLIDRYLLEQRDKAVLTLYNKLPKLLKFTKRAESQGAAEVVKWIESNREALASVDRLDLSQQNLSVIPQEIGKLRNLTILYLGKNRLDSLPEEIEWPTHLNGVDLEENLLSDLPNNLPEEIIVLNLSKNRFTSFPGKLPSKLRLLYIGGNQIPPSSSKPPGPVVLGLEDSSSSTQELPTLAKLEEDLAAVALCAEIKRWAIDCEIPIPPDIEIGSSPSSDVTKRAAEARIWMSNNETTLNKATQVYLQGCNISLAPKEIAKLKNLTHISLSMNQLRSFPEGLSSFRQLMEINLNDNQITALHENMNLPRTLARIDLRKNLIPSLPRNMNLSPNLTKLILSGNKIRSIPEDIIWAPKLIFIDLSENEIPLLSAKITWPCPLEERDLRLDLRGNPIRSLPPGLARPGLYIQLDEESSCSIS